MAIRSRITLRRSCFLPHRTLPGNKSYNAQARQVPEDQKDFHYGILYADVFPVGTAGIPPTLLMQDMSGFFAPISC